ncbi:MAG: alpha/beta hydrolase [Pseudomonadota bacterium]
MVCRLVLMKARPEAAHICAYHARLGTFTPERALGYLIRYRKKQEDLSQYVFSDTTQQMIFRSFRTCLLKPRGLAVSKQSLTFAVLALLLSACAAPKAQFAYYTAETADGLSVSVLAATPREPVDDPSLRFNGGRHQELSFAEIDVWIPRDRKPGTIKLPSDNPDPASEFGVTGLKEIDTDREALQTINRKLRDLPAGERNIFIFVHGYNVSYVSGVYRHAQMLHDFGQSAVGLHYSWPSAAKTSAYLYDRDSVQFARDGLQQTIEMAASSDADSVAVVAHSMGTLLTMEAIRQLSLSGKKSALRRISPLILASPDIDEDVFGSQIAVIDPKPDPFVILASRRDKALKFSRDLRGGTPRVGQGESVEELQNLGITVIDLTEISDSQDRASHATFANSPTLIGLIQSGAISPETLPDDNATFASRVGDNLADILYLGN